MPKSSWERMREHQRKREKALEEAFWKASPRPPANPIQTGKPLPKTPKKPKLPHEDEDSLLAVDGEALQEAITAPIPPGAPVPDPDVVLTLEDEARVLGKPLKPRTSEDNRLNEDKDK